MTKELSRSLPASAIQKWREECANDARLRSMIFADEWRQVCDLALEALAKREIAPIDGDTPRSDAHFGKGYDAHCTVHHWYEFAKQLERELIATAKDAQRYRWLRSRGKADKPGTAICYEFHGAYVLVTDIPSDLDTVIDEELATHRDGELVPSTPSEKVLNPDALYEAASEACTLIADMQPNPGTNHAKVLVKLANALQPYDKARGKPCADRCELEEQDEDRRFTCGPGECKRNG